MALVILDVQLVVQCFLYFACFFLGFVISIPLGVTLNNFGGSCILYADIEWDNSDHALLKPTSNINCNFGIYLSVFGCIFYGLGMTVYHVYALTRKDPEIGSKMWVAPFLLLNTIMAIVIFISSCMISVGFLQFCDAFMKYKDHGRDVQSCADGENWSWKNVDNGDIYGGNFFRFLTVVQIASWTCFLAWFVQIILGIIRVIRNRRLRTGGDVAGTSRAPEDLDNFAASTPTA